MIFRVSCWSWIQTASISSDLMLCILNYYITLTLKSLVWEILRCLGPSWVFHVVYKGLLGYRSVPVFREIRHLSGMFQQALDLITSSIFI